MTSVSKNMHAVILDDTVNEHNNIYHRAIEMKPTDVHILMCIYKTSAYIDFEV